MVGLSGGTSLILSYLISKSYVEIASSQLSRINHQAWFDSSKMTPLNMGPQDKTQSSSLNPQDSF